VKYFDIEIIEIIESVNDRNYAKAGIDDICYYAKLSSD
jgi:hypothetical protein